MLTDAIPAPDLPAPFEFEGILGQGGMGLVVGARDPRLNRQVAIKLLRRDDPALARRFLLEAKAQALIEHPNVCRVYEVGEFEGQPYIVMQYIAGPSLADARAQLSQEQKVTVMRDVARALHAAHLQGLIHRDIKPSNVLVEHLDDGPLVPYVVDFGLARTDESPHLTTTGVVVGTPAYMAPEQAQPTDAPPDARTDVYGLGATLYELLTDLPPFPGDKVMEVLLRVISEVPPHPRALRRDVPRDLDTIAMVCLRKTPAKRYASAQDLADDLQRVLDGEPIKARPTGLGTRVGRVLQKHRLTAVMMTLALIALAIVGGQWLGERRSTAERMAVAQQFGQEVERMEGIAWRSRTIPLHDTRPEKALIRQQMASIENRMEQLGPTAVGPGHYALGRGHLALDEYEPAIGELQTAWDAGYDAPLVAYALGLSYARQDEREIGTLRGFRPGDLRDEAEEQLAREYQEPALRWLRLSDGVPLESPGYIEGLFAYNEKRYDEALEAAQRALEATPWLYEAELLVGDIHMARAFEAVLAGDRSGGRDDFREAQEAYQRAASVGSSDARCYQRLAGLWTERLTLHFREDDLSLQMDSAQDALERAMIADPEQVGPLIARCRLHTQWARHIEAQGEDPAAAFDEAVRWADQALELHPDDPRALHQRGVAEAFRGRYEVRQGRDPRAAFDRAIESLEQALAAAPSAHGYVSAGGVHEDRADYEYARGRDPRAALTGAQECYRLAIELNPNLSRAHRSLGLVLSTRGQYELEQGGLADQWFEESIAALEVAISIHGERAPYHLNLRRGQRPARQSRAELPSRLGAAPPLPRGADGAGRGDGASRWLTWITGRAGPTTAGRRRPP